MPYRKGMVRQYGSELSIIHRMLDAAIILVALWACGKGYGVALELPYQLAGMVAVLGFLFISELNALYSSWRAGSIRREAWSIFSTWFLTCSIMLALVFLSKLSIQFSRVTILAWTITTPILLVGERLLLRYILRRF